MYRSTEERIAFLEKEMKRQAFQIQLLNAIICKNKRASLYELIIQLNISEESYNELKKMTAKFENQLDDGFVVTLSLYIKEVETIFEKNKEAVYFSDLSTFIPSWLGGKNGGEGFSQKLYEHFYK